MAEPLTLRLPFPISVNSMFQNRSAADMRGRMVTERYMTWRRAADNEVLLQNRNPRRSFNGPVHIHVLLGAPDGRRRDGDNLLKAVFDCLKRNGIIEDDCNKIIRRAGFEWAPVTGAVVTVAPWDLPAAALAQEGA